MSDPTIDAQAPTPEQEIAQIEKAVGAETESAEQTEVQEPSAFDKLAGKKGFKSVDDLVGAYESLESKMNPTMKELKELKGMVKDIQESNKPVKEDPYANLPKEQQEALDLLGSLLDQKLKTKLSPLLKKLEVEEASKQIQTIRKQFPGVDDGEIEQAISIMEKYPKMALEDAVKLSSYDRATSVARKKTETAQKTKRAFTESATSAKTGDTDYSKLTISELEEMLNIPAHAR